ncbi:hypothetical protein [Thermoactinomyces mirandus]|uniref:Uncharacterized protein n=1 Tax=Thermoactinomyces mirandus TaxID=2756294 RepID=A0A7W2ARJ1_9BACL|nr:hypothetical protein [Thermoactinomyces mirandus]MBA4601625.1 hypothetical protein [Thermoactinomyces mirandus]
MTEEVSHDREEMTKHNPCPWRVERMGRPLYGYDISGCRRSCGKCLQLTFRVTGYAVNFIGLTRERQGDVIELSTNGS